VTLTASTARAGLIKAEGAIRAAPKTPTRRLVTYYLSEHYGSAACSVGPFNANIYAVPLVAAPAAVIGVTAAVWFLIAKFFGLQELPAGQFAGGFVFGLGVFLLLSACHQAPVAPVVAARWRSSLLLAVQCGAAFWFLGASVFGGAAGWLLAATGGMTALLADRRTAVDKTVRDVYRWMLAVTLLGALGEVLIAWVISGHLAIALGVAAAVLVAALAPVGNFPRWSAHLVAPLPAISLQRPQPKISLPFVGTRQRRSPSVPSWRPTTFRARW
jgi:hypothetical protein